MACSSESDALRVPDCGWSVQWPNDKNPMFFTPVANMAAAVPIPWDGEGGGFSAGLVPTAIHEGTLKQGVNRL
ncbi:hypothetical protein GCM10017711_31890 [Paeniglutamicibacter sulfureus]